mmetsp:Transcript_18777/g.30679  ORF Transcript_18777/g.30679 Transcript_18777/m.30679 type:complete len:194 (+) Transcript_18777:225-806(+)
MALLLTTPVAIPVSAAICTYKSHKGNQLKRNFLATLKQAVKIQVTGQAGVIVKNKSTPWLHVVKDGIRDMHRCLVLLEIQTKTTKRTAMLFFKRSFWKDNVQALNNVEYIIANIHHLDPRFHNDSFADVVYTDDIFVETRDAYRDDKPTSYVVNVFKQIPTNREFINHHRFKIWHIISDDDLHTHSLPTLLGK